MPDKRVSGEAGRIAFDKHLGLVRGSRRNNNEIEKSC